MKTNYHTHTKFCDGKACAQDMVLDAISCGFDILGFSSHAAYPYQSEWHIKTEKYQEYVSTIRSLAQEYKEKIKILLGFEADFLPAVLTPDKNHYKKFNPDFIIGSVHYVINFENPSIKGFPQKDCDIPVNCFAIDGSEEEVKYGLEKMFSCDGKKVVQTYFSLEREMISSCNFDIIGHPDIVRKRNSTLHFFDENDEWYKKELKETALAIAKSGKIAEVNYGGISRGTLNDTYPSLPFLELLKKYDVPLTISSDSHNVAQMNNGYDFAIQQIKNAGYSEFFYLYNGKWLKTTLD